MLTCPTIRNLLDHRHMHVERPAMLVTVRTAI
eukprot:SAG31_NODE_41903_length_274_cov_0.582857_1_plen_31_part_01